MSSVVSLANIWAQVERMYYNNSENDPEQLVGRFARVVNCGDATWDGACGELFSYRISDGTYEIKSNIGSNNFKSSNLQLFSPAGFLIQYPRAPIVQGSHAMSELPHGSVIDFSKMSPDTRSSRQLTISDPCRITGAKISQTSRSRNSINNHIVIETANDDDLVEFDSVYFERSGEWWVECKRGQIVFRRCMFVGNRTAIVVVDFAMVTIESCTFSRINECAVELQRGVVTIINSAFVGVGAVAVARDTSSTLEVCYCTVQASTNGVIALYGATAKVSNCNFQSIANSSVSVSTGAVLNTDLCVSSNCRGNAIIIQGAITADGTVASVTNWTITQCKVAIRIGSFSFHSEVDVSLRDIKFQECQIGAFIAADVTGQVDISGHAGSDNNIVNVSGNKCNLRVSGFELPPGAQVNRLRNHQALLAALDVKYTCAVSAVGKRALQQAGVADIKCAKCASIAPIGTIYKKCDMCREVRYCGRECQKQHWGTHHLECRVSQVRRELTYQKGYVACDKCGKIEESGGAQHSACSRCVNAFYCSRECQRAGWAVHKKKCTQYVKPC